METSQKIKRYRMQKEMTQEELAEATNLSISYISQVETGRKKMGRVGLEKVAAILEVPVGRLLEPDLAADESAKKNQILREVSDCNEYEMNVIYDTVLHLKKSLRKNRQ
ncbi:MAG: helix-turn-helix domain-containing protein [Lachnospiraceae bacterium]|nr:helix-turn-helix domain-containing protein [Lachnospiraceae bacterium]